MCAYSGHLYADCVTVLKLDHLHKAWQLPYIRSPSHALDGTAAEITRRGLDNPQHKTQITPHNMRHALGSAAHDASRLGGATACTQDSDGCRHLTAPTARRRLSAAAAHGL